MDDETSKNKAMDSLLKISSLFHGVDTRDSVAMRNFWKRNTPSSSNFEQSNASLVNGKKENGKSLGKRAHEEEQAYEVKQMEEEEEEEEQDYVIIDSDHETDEEELVLLDDDVQDGFPCPECNKVFGTETNMERHRKRMHLEKNPTPCPLCESVLAHKNNISVHLWKCYHDTSEKVDETIETILSKYFEELNLWKKGLLEEMPKVPGGTMDSMGLVTMSDLSRFESFNLFPYKFQR